MDSFYHASLSLSLLTLKFNLQFFLKGLNHLDYNNKFGWWRFRFRQPPPPLLFLVWNRFTDLTQSKHGRILFASLFFTWIWVLLIIAENSWTDCHIMCYSGWISFSQIQKVSWNIITQSRSLFWLVNVLNMGQIDYWTW